ncbi:MAG: type I glyceraldehyde-3-phosphate dehydrogenase, partial [Patescibacteria group bacterium]|nr:type I glyceraldehyde-3-phosphate dehydrogenase [Patescibacteria group bacterium]
MSKLRVAINGFGRIGRNFFNITQEYPNDLEVVAVNDIGSIDNIIYLLKYDSVYKRNRHTIAKKDDQTFTVDGREVAYISEKDPATLPWGAMKVDVVVESTGLFTSADKASAHLKAGAKRVVISAPSKDEPGAAMQSATILMGLNEEKFSTTPVTSNASCTTNGASPVIAILDEAIGIEKAILSTTHAYTASQSIVDGPAKKDIREGRAAALNIVPTSTGAAIAVTKAYTKLEGKFDGISLRVPVPAGSIADVTFISKKTTTAEEVNNILRKAAKSERWQGIFEVAEDPLVSSDIVGTSVPSIAELSMTRVVDGNLVKVLAWYDNESGYSHSLVKHVIKAGKM